MRNGPAALAAAAGTPLPFAPVALAAALALGAGGADAGRVPRAAGLPLLAPAGAARTAHGGGCNEVGASGRVMACGEAMQCGVVSKRMLFRPLARPG